MNKIVLLFISILLLFVSCSKENEEIGEIDKPGQEIPPTGDVILGQSTILLTDTQINHITNVNEDGELVFDSSTDKSILPSVGQILLISQPYDKFPYGFLGKVSNVSTQNGKYTIKTETATLDEAFDYLQINTTVELVPKETAQTRLSVSKDEDNFWMISQDFQFKAKEGKTSASVSGIVNAGLKLTVCIDINHNIKKSYGYFIVQSKFNLATDFSLGLEGKLPPIEEPIGMPIPLTCSLSNILVKPVVQFYYVSEAEGKISTTAHFSYSTENSAAVAYNKGAWDAGSHEVKPGKPTFSLDHISLDGNFFSGIATGLEIRLFGMKNLKASFQPKIGANWSGNFTLSPGLTYESLKNANVTASFDLKVDAEITPGVMSKNDPKFSASLFDVPFYKKSYYLLPDFTNVDVKTDAENKAATLSCTVSREVLFPVNVGWGLYLNNEPVGDSGTIRFLYQDEFKNPFQHTFTNLNNNDVYIACPYVGIPNLLPNIAAIPVKQEFALEEILIGKWKLESTIVVSEGDMKGENVTHDMNEIVVFNKDGTGHRIGEYINGHWDSDYKRSFIWRKTGNAVILNNGESSIELLSLEHGKFTTKSTLTVTGINGEETAYDCVNTYLRMQIE